MRNVRPILFCIAGTLLLQTGCGQKGPLYRPDEQAQQVPAEGESSTSGKKKPLPVFPAPQSQKEDRATEAPPPSDSTSPPEVDPARPATPPPPGT